MSHWKRSPSLFWETDQGRPRLDLLFARVDGSVVASNIVHYKDRTPGVTIRPFNSLLIGTQSECEAGVAVQCRTISLAGPDYRQFTVDENITVADDDLIFIAP